MNEYENQPFIRGIGYTDRHFVERMMAELEGALNDVFRSVAARAPILSMHWGHMDPVGMQIEKLAIATGDGVTLHFSRAQVGSDCIHLIQPVDEPGFTYRHLAVEQARELRRYWASLDSRDLLEVGPDGTELLELLRSISDERFVAPFYQMRLGPKSQPLGGIGFQGVPSRPLTAEHKLLLAEMEPAFRLTLLSCLQMWSMLSFREIGRPGAALPSWRAEDVEDRIIGAKGALRPVMELARKVAPLDVSVLISGESGTGKEVVARAVHALSPRASRPFVALNCGAIPAGLLESELFGHAKGAFTGAVTAHMGCFERADGGVLFLDEVGELPPEAQIRFLRILEDRVVERVGSNTPISLDVRIIAATNRRLEELVRQGRFRADLWYRLRAVRLEIPPLRERKADIPALVQHFLKYAAARFHWPPHALADGEMARLLAYPWPGNVRELRHTVEEALVRCQGQALHFDLLPDAPVFPPSPSFPFVSLSDAATPDAAVIPATSPSPAFAASRPHTLEAGIRARLQEILTECRGRIDGPNGAATRLGLKPSTLRSKLDRFGLPYGRRWKK